MSKNVHGITIGIGAGSACDGQVLVLQDLLGMYSDIRPKFVRQFAEAGSCIRDGVASYCAAVRDGTFPDSAHSFAMDDAVYEALETKWG